MGRKCAVEKSSQIYDLLVIGLDAGEIAERLHMTESGIRHHICKIYFKHNVASHAKLIAKHYLSQQSQARL